jgi:hypothetical protein
MYSGKIQVSNFLVLGIGLSIAQFVFLINCGVDIEDSTPPGVPQWVEKSLPEEWPERGIDAHESGGIILEWVSSLQEDIASYDLFRAIKYDTIDSIGQYQIIAKIDMESGNEIKFIDKTVNIRTCYYYKLRAVDVSGNLSEFSDPLHYTLFPHILGDEMIPNGTENPWNNDTELRWIYSFFIEMEDYCLTLVTQSDSLIYRSTFLPNNYQGVWESWSFGEDLGLIPNSLYKWRIDVGAKYINLRETAGSESPWATILYVES